MIINSDMTELRHLQQVILSIAKDIDKICIANGIEYYLLGGSAIGAIRHKGFIPWDDDLDIIMDARNYDKFIRICREQLDRNKYYLQEGYVDWPMPFSKIKLLGTRFDEPSAYSDSPEHRGIFIDVFKLENAPNNTAGQMWQYFCAKVLLCRCLAQRGFENPSLGKRLLMAASFPLKLSPIYNFFKDQVEKYNNQETNYYGFFGGRYRYKQSIYRKELYSHPIYVQFEDYKLPVPEKYDEQLRQVFGDYMTPPPVKEQVGLHLQTVDFGKY